MITIERSDGMIIIPLSALHDSHGWWNGLHIKFRFSAIARALLNHFSSNISFAKTRRLIGKLFCFVLKTPFNSSVSRLRLRLFSILS